MRTTPFRSGVLCLAAASTGAIAARAHAQETVRAAPPDEPIDRGQSRLRLFLERYAVDRASLRRRYPVAMSPERLRRMKRFYAGWSKRLELLAFGDLGQDGRIDYLLFKNHLRHALTELGHAARRDAEVVSLVPFWKTIVQLAEARMRMEPVDPAGAADRLDQLGNELQRLRSEVGKRKVARTVASRAVARIRAQRADLRNWYGFYNGYHPEFSWWVRKPYERADAELDRYAQQIREKLVGARRGADDPVVGDPLGEKALLDELAYEMIPYSPQELIDIANREFAWCERQMLRASAELGCGDDWKKALAKVKTLHVAAGKQPELIRDLALEAERFLDERKLVTIPALCRETWRMRMMSPQRQKVNPYFTGGEVISVSFPTDGMTHSEKLMSMRGNNIHFSRATVHHELIPGHHLQGFMAARHRTYRRIFSTPFLIEGWALYWEMLLWDLEFQKSPENRVGMLFWRMHRCARIIFSLSFHLEQMTAPQAIEFLIERVGHERNNATAEVRRSVAGNYGPLYQCAYMLGGLQIRALRRQLVGTGKGKMSDRAFHDAILRENSIPIEMIRASLTRQELSPDFASRWRFDDGSGK